MERKSTFHLMICTPFGDLSNEEIKESIHNITDFMTDEIVNRFSEDNGSEMNEVSVIFFHNHINYCRPTLSDNDREEDYKLMCMANGLSNIMAECDFVVFGPGWEKSRGCLAEATVAVLYHKPIFALTLDEDSQYGLISDREFKQLLKDNLFEL